MSFTRGGYHRIASSVPHGTGGYEVHRPDHWLLAGTGLRRGDQLGAAVGVVGYECDGCELTYGRRACRPGPPGFEVVATAPATPFDRAHDAAAAGARRRATSSSSTPSASASTPSRCATATPCSARYTDGAGTVVTVGCTDWAYGLDDPAVARVTRNILDRLG